MRFPIRLAVLFSLALFSLSARAVAQFKPLFDAPLVVAGTDARLVKTLDLDGNGWADAIGWWQVTVTNGGTADARLTGYVNDGTGKLVPSWNTLFSFVVQTPEFLDPHDASAVGDLNQDGRDDFVIVTLFDIRVYLSNGAAAPTLAIQFTPGDPLHGIALADFDVDGDLDLAIDEIGTLRIFRLDFANQTLVQMSRYETGWTTEGPLLAGEFTGDANPDLLQTGTRIYPVVGGVLHAPVIHAFPWGFAGNVSFRHDTGDVDGDGDLDVVTFRVPNPGTAEYRVLRRTAPDTFVAEPMHAGGPARRLFDLDGDGDLDGTCCGGGGGSGPPQNTAASRFRMSWNDGTGNFSPSVSMPGLGSTAIAGVVDLDHNGFVDLVAGRCVYYATGPITGTALVPLGTRLQDERTLHDYDWEGDPDVELSLAGVRANLGDGTEVARELDLPAPMPGYPRVGEGIPGDWDGDSVVDLLAILGTPTAPLGLEFLRNVGCGSFESKGIVAGPSGLTITTDQGPAGYPTKVDDSLAADMDGDGDLDLVLRTRSGGMTGQPYVAHWSGWLRNDGPAGFTGMSEFPQYLLLHVGDFNGDELPDLLGVQLYTPGGYDEEPLQLAFGLGGGAFGPWGIIQATAVKCEYQFDQVSVADLDLDGDLDLVHAYRSTWESIYARVHLNDGAGHLVEDDLDQELALDGTSNRFGAALATDLNADGLVDLVFGAVKTAPNCAAIYLRKADNSDWEPPVMQVMFEALGSSQHLLDTHLTARDPDGDRDPDLITDRLITNRLYEGSRGGARRQMQDGQPGTGAIVPTLGASGPFRFGMTARLRLRGALPATGGELLISGVGAEPLPFGQGILNRRLTRFVPLLTSGVPGDPAGSGTWTKTFAVPVNLIGQTLAYQVLIDDPASPSGWARSNTLHLAFGW